MNHNTQETEQNKNIHPILKKIRDSWNSPIVLRKDIKKFSHGLVTVRSMQTFDSHGNGIKKKILINGKIAYDIDDVIEWLDDRIKKIEDKNKQKPHKNDILINL